MNVTMDQLDQLAASAFDGYLVRKDLVRKYARQYPVPTYVVEFLLGRYCASTDEQEIAEGLEIVEKQLRDRTVRTGEEELFKARAKEHGSVKLIDIVRARLDTKNDCYVAELPSLAVRDVRIADELVRENERMLTDGFYAEVTVAYDGIVAQENGGPRGDLAGGSALLWSYHLRCGFGWIAVGILEEAELVLGYEDVADCIVEGSFGDSTVFESCGEGVAEGGAGHLHVDTGVDRSNGCVGVILCEAVGGEALNGGPVADDHAAEVPVVTEDIVEEEAVAGGRHSVEVHVRAHEGACSGFEGGVEGREVDVPKLLVGDVGLFVVAATGCCAVAGEVLDAGHDVVGGCEVVALEAFDLGFRHARAEEGIFAGSFHHAAPARVSRDVDHGSKGPLDAGGAGFAGGHGLRLFGYCRVPTGGHGDGDGIDGAEAVDDVEAEEERNVEAALLDRGVLEAIDFGGVGDEEEGAHISVARLDVGGRIGRIVKRDLRHLA